MFHLSFVPTSLLTLSLLVPALKHIFPLRTYVCTQCDSPESDDNGAVGAQGCVACLVSAPLPFVDGRALLGLVGLGDRLGCLERSVSVSKDVKLDAKLKDAS